MPKKPSQAALLKKLKPQAASLSSDAISFIKLVDSGERPLPSIASLIRVLVEDLGVELGDTAIRRHILKVVGRVKW